MTIPSVLAERSATWQDELHDWGYELEWVGFEVPNEIRLRARRREDFGPPEVRIDVREAWLSGADPDELDTDRHGCYLEGASRHAQFGPAGDPESADRLDVDRTKSPGTRIHRHPLGSPNSTRVPCPLPTPDGWLASIEELVYRQTPEELKPSDEEDDKDLEDVLD